MILALLLALTATTIDDPMDMDDFVTVDMDLADVEVGLDIGEDPEDYHSHDRILNAVLADPTRPGRLQFLVLHRAGSPVFEAPLRDGLGMDGGLRVGLGLRYGLAPGVDIGVLRASGLAEPFDIYEFDMRASVMRGPGFAVGVRVGATTFYAPESTATSWFVQAPLQRRLSESVVLVVSPTYHADSTAAVKSAADTDWAFGVEIGAEAAVTETMSVAADVTMGLAGYTQQYPGVAAGLKWRSWRHTFALLVSTTNHVTVDGRLPNTPGGLDESSLGFNVTREF